MDIHALIRWLRKEHRLSFQEIGQLTPYQIRHILSADTEKQDCSQADLEALDRVFGSSSTAG